MIDENYFDIFNLDLEIDDLEKSEYEINYEQDYNVVFKVREKLLRENGIVLLDPMPKMQRRRINEIVRNFDDISSFSIGENERRRVLIRRIKKNIFIDHKRLLNLADKAYKEKDYEKCIKKNLLFLNTSKYTDSSLYKKMGVIYYNNKNIDKAIEYFTAANLMNSKYMLDGIIDNLKNNIIQYTIYDMKSHPKVLEEEFKDLNYDTIFEKFNNYVISNNMTIEDACNKLDLSEEEKYVIILKYAKYYYTMREDKKADVFLKKAIRMKNKPEIIKDLIDEINKNKKIYKNGNYLYIKKLIYPKLK